MKTYCTDSMFKTESPSLINDAKFAEPALEKERCDGPDLLHHVTPPCAPKERFRPIPLHGWVAERAAAERATMWSARELRTYRRRTLLQKTAVARDVAEQLILLTDLFSSATTGEEENEENGAALLPIAAPYLHEPCGLDWFTVTISDKRPSNKDHVDSVSGGVTLEGSEEKVLKSSETPMSDDLSDDFSDDYILNVEMAAALSDSNKQTNKQKHCPVLLADENLQCHLLGALLYELFTGNRPFPQSDHPREKISAKCNANKVDFAPRAMSAEEGKFVYLLEDNEGGCGSRGNTRDHPPSIPVKDLAFTHAVFVSKSECKDGELLYHRNRNDDVDASSETVPDEVLSSKPKRHHHNGRKSSSNHFVPLLELGLPQSICSLVRNLLKCGWGDFRPDEAYNSLRAARDDLRLLLDDPDRFMFEGWGGIGIGSDEAAAASKCGRSLRIPRDRLYGRENEIKAITEAVDRVLSSGINEAVTISGFSGSGKSQLARCVNQRVTKAGGYVLLQKFDLKLQEHPLSVVMSAFNELCTLVAQKNSAAKLEEIAGKLKVQLGENISALTKILPNASVIVGAPAPGARKPTSNIEPNLTDVCVIMQLFMKVVSSTSHPVMLILDDLQWGDAASLGLILAILIDTRGSSCFFFIGTYRENEISADHAIFQILEDLVLCNMTITNLRLDGICEYDLNALISDALCLFPRLCKTLAHIVHHKTKGNPFFVLEFLRTLIDRGLLTYSFHEQRWTWDMENIGAENITDNVLHLLTSKMHTLPDELVAVMKMVACLGMRVSPDIIKRLPALSQGQDIISILDHAVAESFMNKVGSDYKFVHDKIREAAYDLIAPIERDRFHYDLGVQMYESTPEGNIEYSILSVVTDQINYGIPYMVESKTKRIKLAELNLKAGTRSMGCSNFIIALSYFDFGISLLSDNHWKEHYQLSLALFQNMAKSAYLCGFPERLAHGIKQILHKGLCLDDKLCSYVLLLKYLFRRNEVRKGFATLQDVMGQLGENVPLSIDVKNLAKLVKTTHTDLESVIDIENLRNLKTLKDKNSESIMHFYEEMCYASYANNPSLYALCACRMVNITLQHGFSKFSASGFSMFATVLCSALANDAKAAYQVGKLALRMLKHSECTASVPKVSTIFYYVVAPIFEPLQTCADMCKHACELSMAASGDTNIRDMHFLCAFSFSFYSGETLSILERNVEHRLKAMKRLSLPPATKLCFFFYRETILSLLGDQKPLGPLTNKEMEGNVLIDTVKAAGVKEFTEILYLNKAISSYWLGHFTRARYYAGKATSSMDDDKSLGKFHRNILTFYHGLIVISMLRTTPQKNLLDEGVKAVIKMKKLANNSQWNYQNKVLLLEAEMLSVQGETEKANVVYCDAINASRRSMFIHEQGLACELAGNSHKETGDIACALDLFLKAKECYAKWGAHTKVEVVSQQIDSLKQLI